MPAKGVPGQIADYTMVLMTVVAIVGEDQVRIQFLVFLHSLQRLLDLGSVVGKESVAKSFYDDLLAFGFLQKKLGAVPGFAFAFGVRAEDNPAHIHVGITGEQLQDGAAA